MRLNCVIWGQTMSNVVCNKTLNSFFTAYLNSIQVTSSPPVSKKKLSGWPQKHLDVLICFQKNQLNRFFFSSYEDVTVWRVSADWTQESWKQKTTLGWCCSNYKKNSSRLRENSRETKTAHIIYNAELHEEQAVKRKVMNEVTNTR